jgi:hypothetical protein
MVRIFTQKQAILTEVFRDVPPQSIPVIYLRMFSDQNTLHFTVVRNHISLESIENIYHCIYPYERNYQGRAQSL